MDDKAWYESFFGEDYFDIYAGVLTPEGTVEDVEGILSLLDLKAGARVLDLACGHGRHAIPLSLKGYEVTGYDLSEVFLERARADAAAQGANVRWVKGDMRELSFNGEFDAVINLFTAFGYFEDPRDDLKTLRGVREALCTGGRFLLETLHRDALPARFQPQGFDRTPSDSIVLHERRWDLARNVMDDDVTLIRPDGSRAQYRTSVRMRSLYEWIQLLEEAGLEPEAWYGGLGGGPLDLNSRRLAIVSRKA